VRQWLRCAQVGTAAVRDIFAEMNRDPELPSLFRNIRELRSHLLDRNACDQTMEAGPDRVAQLGWVGCKRHWLACQGVATARGPPGARVTVVTPRTSLLSRACARVCDYRSVVSLASPVGDRPSRGSARRDLGSAWEARRARALDTQPLDRATTLWRCKPLRSCRRSTSGLDRLR
jgi:hypothetical protein